MANGIDHSRPPPVIVQIVLLALASAVRPSSFVAVYALVRERSPSRLMAAYVIAGLAFTLAVGAAVVWLFSGVQLNAGSDRTKAIAELAAGAFAVALGVALLVVPGSLESAASARVAERGRARRSERRLSTRAAALAGPATHLPGLLYILALDLIVAGEPGLPGELIQVGVYNALWFAPPLVVLAVCIVDPAAARAGVQRVDRWARARARAIALVVTFGVGVWLLIDGALTI